MNKEINYFKKMSIKYTIEFECFFKDESSKKFYSETLEEGYKFATNFNKDTIKLEDIYISSSLVKSFDTKILVSYDEIYKNRKSIVYFSDNVSTRKNKCSIKPISRNELSHLNENQYSYENINGILTQSITEDNIKFQIYNYSSSLFSSRSFDEKQKINPSEDILNLAPKSTINKTEIDYTNEVDEINKNIILLQEKLLILQNKKHELSKHIFTVKLIDMYENSYFYFKEMNKFLYTKNIIKTTVKELFNCKLTNLTLNVLDSVVFYSGDISLYVRKTEEENIFEIFEHRGRGFKIFSYQIHKENLLRIFRYILDNLKVEKS